MLLLRSAAVLGRRWETVVDEVPVAEILVEEFVELEEHRRAPMEYADDPPGSPLKHNEHAVRARL